MSDEQPLKLSAMPTLGSDGNSESAFMLQEGSLFGQYRIVSRLGRGGMGEVYEAEQLTLQQLFALKLLLHQQTADPRAEQHFIEEARVMAQLEHPNIIRVDDFGETDGLYWLRMELAKGGSLGDTRVRSLAEYADLNGRRLDPEEVEAIFRQILDGLAYTHARGLVHRDLKPANILIDSDPEGYAIFKIADFGLVRMIGEEWVQKQALTSFQLSLSIGDQDTRGAGLSSSGQALVGTFEYMSPEQKHGQAAGPASDVYSIGLMLYRLLTGVEISPRPPSYYVPGLPSAWDDFILCALEEDPADRFADAAAMLAALPEVRPPAAAATPVAETVAEQNVAPPRSEEPAALRVKAIPDSAVVSSNAPVLQMANEPEFRMRRPLKKIILLVLVVGIGVCFFLFLPGRNKEEIAENTSAENAGLQEPDKLQGLSKPEQAMMKKLQEMDSPPANTAGNRQTKLMVSVSDGTSSVQQSFVTGKHKPAPASKAVATSLIEHAKTGIKLVKIPAGQFLIGSPETEAGRGNNETLHRVTLNREFYIGRYEVTQEQWIKVMGSNPSIGKSAGLQAPVENISWEEAMEFCFRLNEMEGWAWKYLQGFEYSLPTEAQWEYACRAGSQSAYSFGNTLTAGQANFNGTGPVSVGSYPPNVWGLYDMHGNVFELVLDRFHTYSASPVTNPEGRETPTFRIARGGCWGSDDSKCRSAFRGGSPPGEKGQHLGFRVCLGAPTVTHDLYKQKVWDSRPAAKKDSVPRQIKNGGWVVRPNSEEYSAPQTGGAVKKRSMRPISPR